MATRNMAVVPTIDLRSEKEIQHELYGYNSMEAAVRAGKRNAWTKAKGGFVIYASSNDNYQWCPFGHPPMLGGERDSRARVIAIFYWNGSNWKQR
ncbi:MAG: hypothetical protein KatS3mg059_1797 [Thermomicrobiales bacterium]|nr:MAG: hypothetical protein KatS3mg059_1785 [Thermomicrobiales bacterium]GIW05177.1 MAG: hypothetical protein KatS3mg059_1797 [Thermomicrobiales bacterium]